jgi:hypothetical protein
MVFRSNRGDHIPGEDISAYVDEELSSREVQRVYGHLQTCDECRALADDLRATKTLVREMPPLRAPRSFTLGPEFAPAPPPARAPVYAPAPKRGWFNFAPAIAMSAAVLMLLVFVDLASFSGKGTDSSGGSSELSAGARSVEDAAKQSAESAAGAAQPPQPPIVTAPRTEPGAPQPGGGAFAPTPIPPGTNEPRPAAAPPGATPMAAQAPAPVLPGGTPPSVMSAPPVIGSPVAGNSAAVPPTPAGQDVRIEYGVSDEDDDGGGTGLLRVLQIIAGVVLVGSIGGLIWQRSRRS